MSNYFQCQCKRNVKTNEKCHYLLNVKANRLSSCCYLNVKAYEMSNYYKCQCHLNVKVYEMSSSTNC